MRRRKVYPRPRRRDRPKGFLGVRRWLVKLVGLDEPVEVLAEHRGAARHYARCAAPDAMSDELQRSKNHYPRVEWCRLKREMPF